MSYTKEELDNLGVTQAELDSHEYFSEESITARENQQDQERLNYYESLENSIASLDAMNKEEGYWYEINNTPIKRWN